MPAGYKPRMCDFGIFSVPKPGPAYSGIPDAACDVEEKEAAAILARWKGSYKLVTVEPGPEMGGGAENTRSCLKLTTPGSSGIAVSLQSFETVYIDNDGMCFSGGTHIEQQTIPHPSASNYDRPMYGEEESEYERDRRERNENRTVTISHTVANAPYTLKLELRRGADGTLYLGNLGSHIMEDSPAELKIKLFQGGKIALIKAK